MAFTFANLYNLNSMPPGFGKYNYKSDTDTRATVMASGYFNNDDDLLNLAADDLITVIGDQGGYTVRVDTVTAATGVVTTEMAGTPVWLGVVIDDVSTADSVFMIAPFDGIITRIKTVLEGVITGSPSAVGVELGGVDVTGAQVTISVSGSGAGVVDENEATALNAVAESDAVEIDTSGASTGAQKLWVYIEFMPV